MASFVVMERGTGARPALDGAAIDSVVVRDGFHFLAFLLPILWFLWHRMWIEALAALALTLALAALASYAGFGSAAPWFSLLVSIYAGLEGAALRLAMLRRRGWRDWGVVEADKAADAETRYLAETVPDEEPSVADAPLPSFGRPSGPALGLFSYPGSR